MANEVISRSWTIEDKENRDSPWVTLKLFNAGWEWEKELRILFEGDRQLPVEHIDDLIKVLQEIKEHA